MTELALNLTKEAVSPKTEAFRQFCKLQIFNEKLVAIIQFGVKMSNTGNTHTHTHNYYNPSVHAPSVNYPLCKLHYMD